MPSRPFPWPGAAAAAVSLTYDDGMVSQAQLAVPALERHDLKGTFFLSDRQGAVSERREAWARAAMAGHELAGHTLSHPCGRGRPWLKPGDALEDFDEARMAGEFRSSSALLESLGSPAPHSYAYTCGETSLGDPRRSYVPLVRAHYAAARGIADRLNDPWAEDLHLCAAIHADKHAAEAMIATVEEARRAGHWAVFMFHGIDEGTLSVSAATHDTLLSYLKAQAGGLYVAPFLQAAQWVAQQRQARGI